MKRFEGAEVSSQGTATVAQPSQGTVAAAQPSMEARNTPAHSRDYSDVAKWVRDIVPYFSGGDSHTTKSDLLRFIQEVD